MATVHPSPSPPTASAATAPSKNTSLNSEVPDICRIGRTSMRPGWSIRTRRKDRPRWRRDPGSVRARTKHQSASWASEVQIFCPVTRKSPSAGSRTAAVRIPARSDPAPGSL